MTEIAASPSTQHRSFLLPIATQRRRHLPDQAAPASRDRCCHAKPDLIAAGACSPSKVNSQYHRPYTVATSQRHTPARLKSP
jgi:hypothetical protein